MTVISSSRMDSAVSGVRSWCEASAASRRSAVSIRPIRSALASRTSATRSSSGTPYRLCRGRGSPEPRRSAVSARSVSGRGQPVGLAYGEQHGGDDREQRDRADDQQGAADLAGDRGAGLLDGDRLALLAVRGAADDVAGRAACRPRWAAARASRCGRSGRRRPARRRTSAVDPLAAEQPALDDADEPERLGVARSPGRCSDGAGLDDDEGDAEDGDDDEHHGERGVDQAAAHDCGCAAQLFSKRKPTPRTVAM